MTLKINKPNQRACLAAAIVGVFLIAPFQSVFAQISEKEHLSHHPEEAAAKAAEKKGSVPGEKPDAKKEGGMGAMGGMMKNMGGMMEKMGAPKARELYPELMRLPDLPMEKRAEVQEKAHQRMRDGVRLIAEAVGELADATPTDDFSAMQKATNRMKEGLVYFDSGLAAHRALAEGSEPRNVALQWFRKEMNLVGGVGVSPRQQGILGMSTFHFISMSVLIVFAILMLWMYFLKMRRATQLIQELALGTGNRETASPSADAHSPAASAAKAMHASDETSVTKIEDSRAGPADPPDFPAMRSRTEPVSKWSGKLQVESVLKETPSAITLRLSSPERGALPFTYFPGQFLTFSVAIDGKPVKRSYTIASTPTQMHYCAVTVKREESGLVSRHLNDDVKEGDLLEVSAANGKFTFTGDESDSIVLIGGGVGITPLMSVIRYLTDIGWHHDIFLIYCCRTTDDFIFRQELEQLQMVHPNLHVYASMTREPGAVWMGLKGYFTSAIINHLVPEIQKRRIHVCGPPPMMDAVLAMLSELDVPDEQVLTEAFGPAKKSSQSPSPPHAKGAKQTTVKFERSKQEGPLAKDETILEAADALSVDIDSSCRSGQCGLCKVKLISGEVTMDCEDSLSKEDKKDGLILACQAKATDTVAVDA